MGNSWSDQVISFALLLYRVVQQKLNMYLYGQWTQGPAGLTMEEINEFENQFAAPPGADPVRSVTPWKWRYGHRLDAPVSEKFKLLFPGAESVDSTDVEAFVTPRVKPDFDPPVVPFDQLSLGCNTVNAVALLVQWFMYRSTPHVYSPSRLFLYYESRSTNSDSDTNNLSDDMGVSFSDVFAVLNLSTPIPDELEWPYTVQNVNKKPPYKTEEVYIPFVGVQLQPTLSNLKTCLLTNGPFVAAVTATRTFELHAKYTYDPSDRVEGYQPLVFTSFSEETQTFTAINSFGASWGNRGRITLHVADLFKDPVFTSSIYTLVPDLENQDEEKSD